MGSFAGHILPGTFLLIMAVWWLLNIWHRYHRSHANPSEKYRNTATFVAPCLPWKLKYIHLEAILKILFCIIGMIGELCTAFYHYGNGYKFYYGNLQHTTMFFFFGTTGVFDLMLHHGVVLPKDTDYVMMALAFAVELLLFYFHLEGRPELDVHLHYLLIIANCGGIITTLVEMRCRKHVLAALGRTFFLFLQGTWFYQVAFILYPPYGSHGSWEMMAVAHMSRRELERYHDQAMLVTCMYAWHAGAIVLLIMLVGGVFRCYYKCMAPVRLYDAVRLIKTDKNGKRFISLPSDADDSESDAEFQQATTSAVAVDIN